MPRSSTQDHLGPRRSSGEPVHGSRLNLTWTGDRVRYVTTDPPGAGQPAPRWTYSYTNGLLTEACAPLSAASCTGYDYEPSSHYRSVVLDHNPVAYWPLGESSGSEAANVAATPGARDAAYLGGVTQGVPGAFGGSTDTAVALDGGAQTAISLPRRLANTTVGFTLEVWVKIEPDETGGVVWAAQNTGLGSVPSRWAALFEVTAGGQVRYTYRTDNPPTVHQGTSFGAGIANGNWHHLVVTGSPTSLRFYRNGNQIANPQGNINHSDLPYSFIGNGRGNRNGSANVNIQPLRGG